MLPQDRQHATVFARVGDDWAGPLVSGNTILDLPEIGISVPLAARYEGVSLQPSGGTVTG
jgi:hypothetical protein